MKDYQTKKGRLTKKDYSADFRLADNDDFFGFSGQQQTSLAEKILYVIVSVFFLFFAYEAVTYIIANGLQL